MVESFQEIIYLVRNLFLVDNGGCFYLMLDRGDEEMELYSEFQFEGNFIFVCVVVFFIQDGINSLCNENEGIVIIYNMDFIMLKRLI